MSKGLLVVTILALPLAAAYAQSAEKSDAKAAAQLGATLGKSDGKPSRKPNLGDVKQTTAELPAGRATESLRVAEPQHLGARPPRDNKIEPIDKVNKVEAKGTRSAYQPVTDGSEKVRGARMGKPRRVQLTAFDPGQLRAGTTATAQADEIARSWKSNLQWNAITVDSYAMMQGRSEAETHKLAQRNADRVRAYLVRRGVPGEYVIATGHVDASTPGAKVELSVMTCDDVTIPCRKPAVAK